MNNEHISSLGSLSGRHGAIYVVKDEEGIFQLVCELKKYDLFRNGRLTPKMIDSEIEIDTRSEESEYHKQILEFGIPIELRKLIEISDKSDLEKYSRNISIKEFNFYKLIHNSTLINYSHTSKFIEFVPSELDKEIKTPKLSKIEDRIRMSRRINSLLEQRKRFHVHLLSRNDQWHCFFFSYNDINDAKNNHWNMGCHIHYLNYLWPNYNSVDVMNAFDSRQLKLSGYLHIPFIPYEFYRRADGVDIPLRRIIRPPNWPYIINSNKEEDIESESMPMAEITTRGIFIIEFPKQ